MKGLSFLSLCFVLILGQTACASRLEFPNGKPTEPLNAPDSDHYWEILVVHDEVELCESPDGEDCAPVTGQWLKHYVVGDEVGEYMLLISLDDNFTITRFHGWAHKDSLLTTNCAKRYPNRVFRKVFAVKNWRRLEQGQEQPLEKAKAWNGLHAGRDIAQNLSFFEIYFVFLEQKDREGKTHYLIGYDPCICDFGAGDQCIVGWLPEDRALIWDTRQALYFNKSNFANRLADDNLGLIFGSPEDVRAWYLEGKRPGETEGGAPLMRESREVMSELPFDWPRFPILDEPTLLSPDLDTWVFKIAFIGDTITSTGQLASRESIEEGRSRLRRLQEEVKNIDLHFVLDTTISMGPEFIQVKKAIEEAVRILEAQYHELKVRFGLLMFKDYEDREKPGSYLFRRIELKQDPTDLLQALERETEKGGGGDGPEASFFAVQKSLELNEPRPGTLSALFLITDAPNKKDGATIHSMVDRLRRHRTSFFPVIHFLGTGAIEEARHAVELLTWQEGSPCAGRVIATDSNSDVMSAQIVEAIEETFNDARTLQSLFAGAHSGNVSIGEGNILRLGKRQIELRLSALFHELMKDANIPPELFVKKQVQSLDEGYVVDTTPGRDRYRLNEGCLETLERELVAQDVIEKLSRKANDRIYSKEDFTQRFIEILSDDERRFYESVIKDVANMDKLVETYVFVDHDTFLSVYGLISRIVKRFERDNVWKNWYRAVRIETGGYTVPLGGESRTIADLIERHTGLPVNEELFRMPLDELERLSSKEIQALYKRLRLKKALLSDIISEQAVAYQFEDGVFKGIVNRGSKPYFIQTLAGNTKYAWIKRKYLP